MEVALPEGTVTWRGRGLKSAIDLVFTTEGATNALRNCGPRADLQYGSDHLPVYTEFEWSWESQTPVQRRAWKMLEDKGVATNVRNRAQQLRLSLGLPQIRSAGEADEYLGQMLDGFQAIVQECIPWAKPSSKARSFWNSACRDTMQRAKRELKAYYRCRNTETRETLREAERAKVATIRREKTLCFRGAIHQALEDPRGV